ncbi:hypothetical protein PanWU01x14_317240, partial [Parasponia andersonii]
TKLVNVAYICRSRWDHVCLSVTLVTSDARDKWYQSLSARCSETLSCSMG